MNTSLKHEKEKKMKNKMTEQNTIDYDNLIVEIVFLREDLKDITKSLTALNEELSDLLTDLLKI